MNTFLWVCAALMALFVTGETLTCNTCKAGIAGKCLLTTTETCDFSQPNCYRGELAFNVSSLMRLENQGCLATALCNRTETGVLLTAGYTITRTCCSTDRCNGARPFQLPVIGDLGAALMSVWSTWGH